MLTRRNFIKMAGVTAASAYLGLRGFGTAQGINLELWHDKGASPNWQPGFEAAAAAIAGLTGGRLAVEQVPFPSTEGYQAAIRPVLGTADAPPLYTWWTGFRLIELARMGFAADVTDIWQRHVDNGEYTQSFMNQYMVDGRAWAAPTALAYWPVWYNRALFQRLGLVPPTSWEGFLELNRSLLAAGVTPLAVPIGDGWPGFIWFEELIFRQDPDFYYRLVVGDEPYTHDIVVRALATIGELVKAGFFGDPNATLVLTIPDMLRGVVEERYAMFLIGDWISGSFAASGADFGAFDWFILPNLNPSLGLLMVAETGPLAASATGPNVDAALEALDAWMSPEVQEAWSLAIGLIFTNARSDVSQLAANKVSLLNAVNTQGITVINRIWEAAPPQVIVPASSVMGRIFAEPDNAVGIAQEIQALADAFFGA